MKKNKFLIILSMSFALFLIVSLTFKIARVYGEEKILSSEKKGRKILYYRAPMDPNYISDKPGKSPMGMDLIPVYEGEETETTGIVKIDPVTVQNMGVRTQEVEKVDLARVIRTVGRVDYDERRVAYVNTKIGGWIEKLYVDYTGQSVEKGERLLEIYSPELVTTQEEYLLAIKYYEKIKKGKFEGAIERAQSLVESSRKRLRYWDITDEQIENLKKTRKVKKTLTIHSPTKGIVIHKNAIEGKYIKPGENLYKIADISRIWVYADIYEYELPWVRVGNVAEISLSYLPGMSFRGEVTFIYPYLEVKTRTVKVRMEFTNPDWELKPDMYADVKIYTDPRNNVLAVPREAVIHSGKRKIIIVDKGKGLFEPREIKTGVATEDYYEVLSGIKEGERVVTSSQFLIDSESKLKEAIAKMLRSKKTTTREADVPVYSQAKIKDSTREIMEEVWKEYFTIRRRLTDDSLLDVKDSAYRISSNLKKILDLGESENLKDLVKKMLKSIDRLYLDDIVRVRDGFSDLSKEMIRYMKEFDREEYKNRKYRIFFCGMDEKYWVQEEDKVGNPYLGKSMSDCGAMEDY